MSFLKFLEDSIHALSITAGIIAVIFILYGMIASPDPFGVFAYLIMPFISFAVGYVAAWLTLYLILGLGVMAVIFFTGLVLFLGFYIFVMVLSSII